jgi:hypothetical protein
VQLWKIGKLLSYYATQQPRRQPFSYSQPWEPESHVPWFIFLQICAPTVYIAATMYSNSDKGWHCCNQTSGSLRVSKLGGTAQDKAEAGIAGWFPMMCIPPRWLSPLASQTSGWKFRWWPAWGGLTHNRGSPVTFKPSKGKTIDFKKDGAWRMNPGWKNRVGSGAERKPRGPKPRGAASAWARSQGASMLGKGLGVEAPGVKSLKGACVGH